MPRAISLQILRGFNPNAKSSADQTTNCVGCKTFHNPHVTSHTFSGIHSFSFMLTLEREEVSSQLIFSRK